MVDTAEIALIKVLNSLYPDYELDAYAYEQEVEAQKEKVLERLAELNQNYPNNPEIFEWSVYKVVNNFIANKFQKPAEDPNKDMRKKRLIDYQVYLFDKIHFAMPQLYLKEMVLGFIGARCMLFWPHIPTEKEIPDLKTLCD